MTILSALRACNPSLPLFSVHDPEFAPYGRVLDLGDTAPLRDALARTGIPAQGNRYLASCDALERTPTMAAIARAFGGMDIQAGFCNGRGATLNALEYHKCSEVNFSTTGLVLLLALPGDLVRGALDSSRVQGFYLPPDVAIELHPRVLHFAPCRVSGDGFRCLVVLEKGVNAPLAPDCAPRTGEDALLWMRGKWLICHPDSPQAASGAVRAITGENITLRIEGGE